jgi:antitoxin (DNA-binding transcriptional repressor) of toxin-antitoxin stability system
LNLVENSGTISTMQTATLDEIQADPRRLVRAIEVGEPIEVFRDGKHVARFVPDAPKRTDVPLKWPDFRARLKARWGERVLTQAELDEMRDFADGELGK